MHNFLGPILRLLVQPTRLSHHIGVISCFGLHPREGKSAGFIAPGRCNHLVLWINSRISCTLFQAKVPHSTRLCIQEITVDGSLQKWSLVSVLPSKLWTTCVHNRAPMTAASSSNLAIVILVLDLLIGAALALVPRRKTLTWFCSYTLKKSTQA